MKEFILPRYWCIKIDDNNINIVNNWKIKQKYNTSILEYNHDIKYVYPEGSIVDPGDGWRWVQITTDQFKEYVLYEKDSKDIINSINYNYLTQLLNKLNIK